jgi:hypothetical protein
MTPSMASFLNQFAVLRRGRWEDPVALHYRYCGNKPRGLQAPGREEGGGRRRRRRRRRRGRRSA